MFMTTFWHLQYMTFIGNCPTGPGTGQDNDNLYVFRHTYVLVFYEPQRKATFMAPLTPEGERVARSHKQLNQIAVYEGSALQHLHYTNLFTVAWSIEGITAAAAVNHS